MLTVVLGLSGALVYGFADFLGGLASRRIRPVVVTALAAVVGIVPLLVGLAVVPSAFSRSALTWGLVGGACGAVGVLLLYAALAIGPMSVLSPLTAVFSAIVPVVVGLARGIPLSALGIVAVAVAVLAVVLVAAVRDTSGARLTARGIVSAVAAGSAFGGLVLAFNETPASSGVAPLVVARVLQAVLMGGAAIATGVVAGRLRRSGGAADPAMPGAVPGSAVPPVRVRDDRRRWAPLLVASIALCGICDAGANVFIQAGLHSSTDPSTLPTMSVLNALYPIGTVVLAGVVLRERLTRVQLAGIVLAVAASVGLALS
ncbi:EamA family transporter [Curtobacterium sp. RRHDQ10]|uniref:EamA family transporter n=1 Tax=Curtobacterium phyllosphaerae TaxID=3413379 RepID=UPI003BF41D9A